MDIRPCIRSVVQLDNSLASVFQARRVPIAWRSKMYSIIFVLSCHTEAKTPRGRIRLEESHCQSEGSSDIAARRLPKEAH